MDPGWGPNNPASPDPLTAFGMDKANGIRTVSRLSIVSYLDQVKSAGKHVMVVVTEQSQEYVYPRADIVQVDNEPDLNGITPVQYAITWNWYRAMHKIPYWALAGLGSGLTNSRQYLEQVWPLLHIKPDMVAVHCYDGDVEQAYKEVVDLWNAVHVPVIVTEWNHPIDQMWDMLAMLNGPDGVSTAWNSIYPYAQQMNRTLPALVDDNGNGTDFGGAWVSAPYV